MVKTTKLIFVIVAVIIASLLIYAGATLLPDDQSLENTQENKDLDSPVNINESIVVTVNGEEITLAEVRDAQQSFTQQQGQQISEETVLQQLINQSILLQQAQQQGFLLSDNETEAELEQLLLQQNSSLEAYQQQVEQQGSTYAEELQKYKEHLSIQRFLNHAFEGENITVTEQEAQSYYQQYQQQYQGDIPPYEEIKSQIVSFLQQQKQQEMITSLIHDLRIEADIEYQ